MPTWRKFWLKTTDSQDLADMPDDFTRLMWVMLPLILDAEGRGIGNPAWVRSKLFPLREDVTHEQVQDALGWFTERGMIQVYEVRERQYFAIPTWHAYQGNTSKEAKSVLPPPPIRTSSGQAPDQLPTNSASDADADSEEMQMQQPATPAALAVSTWLKASGGAINNLTVDEINDLVDECEAHRQELPPEVPGADVTGDEWVAEAIKETVSGIQRPQMKYTRTVLNRWRAEGYKAHPPSRASPRYPPPSEPPQYTDLQPWE